MFKTIDELVEKSAIYYARNKNKSLLIPITQSLFETIVSCDLKKVKDTLNSDTNVPSKYDIFLIQQIGRILKIKDIFRPSHIELIDDVLQFYKNRKIP